MSLYGVYVFSPLGSPAGRHPGQQQAVTTLKTDAAAAAHQAAAPRTPPGTIDGVVVLGMHRSGTSMLTGLLERMGLHLGDPGDLLVSKAGENDKGFFERLQVVVQNDDLMKEQDVNWSLNVYNFDHLKALEHALTGQVPFGRGRAALAYYNDPAHRPWALKDPRLCFTLRFWLPFWRTPPAVVLVYRHPVEVAKSLARRKEFGVPRGIHLWVAYNRLAIENSRGLCRVVVSDAALVHDGPVTVRHIYEQLRACGVAVPRVATLDDLESFIDPGLRHHKQAHDHDCHPTAPQLWTSDAESAHERHREETAYKHALRVYCAMEDGSAFEPDYEWEFFPDVAPQ